MKHGKRSRSLVIDHLSLVSPDFPMTIDIMTPSFRVSSVFNPWLRVFRISDFFLRSFPDALLRDFPVAGSAFLPFIRFASGLDLAPVSMRDIPRTPNPGDRP